MGKRGPKVKPITAVRPVSVAVSSDSWDCPAHLTGEARVAWDHVVALLDAAGNLGRTDPTLVEAYAVKRAMLRAAHEAIGKDGTTTTNGAGALVLHPAVAIVNSATMRLKAIINDLGLCPATSKYEESRAT